MIVNHTEACPYGLITFERLLGISSPKRIHQFALMQIAPQKKLSMEVWLSIIEVNPMARWVHFFDISRGKQRCIVMDHCKSQAGALLQADALMKNDTSVVKD
jgi:hypothetical protein